MSRIIDIERIAQTRGVKRSRALDGHNLARLASAVATIAAAAAAVAAAATTA